MLPSSLPSISTTPTHSPTDQPSDAPSDEPSVSPSDSPSESPSMKPSVQPSDTPSSSPSVEPSERPSLQPTLEPSTRPTESSKPSEEPSTSIQPSASPSASAAPSGSPSKSFEPTESVQPSNVPSSSPMPTLRVVIIIIIISIEFASADISWQLTDTTGNIVAQMPFDMYPVLPEPIVHRIEVLSGAEYHFTLFDRLEGAQFISQTDSYSVAQGDVILAAGNFGSHDSITFTTTTPQPDTQSPAPVEPQVAVDSLPSELCETVLDCIGVRSGSGCPLCRKSHPDDEVGICEEGCSGSTTTNLSSRACCKWQDDGLEFSCTSSCQDGVCLQNPGLNWINNQELRCDADSTSTVCSEELPNGGTVDISGHNGIVIFQPLSVCQAAVKQKMTSR